MKSETIGVEGMSCDHCIKTIQKALAELVGVKSVSVSLGRKEVEVDFDENQVRLVEISSKINGAGFEVSNYEVE